MYVLLKIGHETKSRFSSQSEYLEKVKAVKKSYYSIQIKSVINSKNFYENLIDFVKEIKPERWNIFQVLWIVGQNDLRINELLISKSKYEDYINKHNKLENHGIEIVAENNDLLIDPQGGL